MLLWIKLRLKQAKLIIVLFMLVLLMGVAIPSYISGKWPWADMPQLQTLPELQAIKKQGLTIPGWQTVKVQQIRIGAKEWLQQQVKRDDQSATVLLKIQSYYKDHPQVEWMDITGFLGWKTDSYRRDRFALKSTDPEVDPVEVEMQVFKAWNATQTYAVAQWYAWPGGGDPAPSQWFWADRWAQLQKQRAAWVAVCLLVPIKPLDNIEQMLPVLTDLGESIQASLMAEALISNQ